MVRGIPAGPSIESPWYRETLVSTLSVVVPAVRKHSVVWFNAALAYQIFLWLLMRIHLTRLSRYLRALETDFVPAEQICSLILPNWEPSWRPSVPYCCDIRRDTVHNYFGIHDAKTRQPLGRWYAWALLKFPPGYQAGWPTLQIFIPRIRSLTFLPWNGNLRD